jgi:preprotein translocase subunit SecF
MRPLIIIKKTPRIDFMRWHKIGLGVAAAITVLAVVLFLVRGLNYGIDFSGGVLIEARASQGAANLGELRSKLNRLDLGEVSLQQFGQPSDVLIRLARQPGGDQAQMSAVNKVRQELGGTIEVRRVEVVGPKVGDELIQAGALATGLALLGIALYVWFRFEWQFGIGAMVATLHDVITTVGLFALLQLEFNLTSLAAVLTIAGYSINDTVVIYDRMREDMRKYKTMDFRQLINVALNQTLSRTILTVSTTMLATLALVLWGGEVLHGFSIAMLWGLVIGTYSSLIIAAPVIYYIRPRRGAEKARAGGEEGTAAEGAS